ncbi:MAG: hypothetical protein LC793_16320 [Thermomicrobia bacterium]|nr:hypothetical protein [Thermomicrobia bacterium]
MTAKARGTKAVTISPPLIGWKFLREDRRLGYGDGRELIVGKSLSVEGALKLCAVGIHFAVRAVDALAYAPGAILCRVETGDEYLLGDDKGCARAITPLWFADATAALYEHQCDCLERMLLQYRALKLEPAQAEWDVIAVNRRWLHGEATIDELITARATARDTAWATAWDTAWATARATTRATAWDTEREWQNANLERLFAALAPAAVQR